MKFVRGQHEVDDVLRAQFDRSSATLVRRPVGAGDLQCQVRVLKRHLSGRLPRPARRHRRRCGSAAQGAWDAFREPEPHLGGSRGPAALRGAITALARYDIQRAGVRGVRAGAAPGLLGRRAAAKRTARTRAGSAPTGGRAGSRQGRPALSAGGGNEHDHARPPDRHWRVTETAGC